MRNLFDTSKLPDEAEQTVLLLSQGGARLEQIVSFGHPTAPGFWYDQSETEWVALLKGEAVLHFAGGRRQALAAGDSLVIPARERHRVESVSADAVWLALFLPSGHAKTPRR